MREFFAYFGTAIVLVTIPIHCALVVTLVWRSREAWISPGPLGERMKPANTMFSGRNARLMNWMGLNIQATIVGSLMVALLSP